MKTAVPSSWSLLPHEPLYNETELRQVSDEMRTQIRHMELIEVPAK